MPSWNPFDWVDSGLDAVGEGFDFVKDAYNNLIESGGKTIFDSTPAGRKLTETTGQLVEPVYDAAKTAVRATVIATDFPLQALNNAMAFQYNNPVLNALNPLVPPKAKGAKQAQASTLEQLVGIVGNTTLAKTIVDAVPGGKRLDLGTGFFPGGETTADVNEKKRELYPTIYGSTYTFGRSFAAPLADSGVIEPGSVAYNVISGGLDVGWTMYADPFNRIPVGAAAQIGDVTIPLTAGARVGKRAKVTTTLSPKARQVLKKAAKAGEVIMNDAGLIDNGRRTVNPNNWEAFKVTQRGKKWLEGFVGDSLDNAAEIWRRSGGQIPPGTADALAKAKTYDEVVEIFDNAVYGADPLLHVRIMPGIDPRPIVTKVGATIKGNINRYRAFGDALPEATDFPLNNPVQAVRNADGVMAVFEIPLETRNALLNELFEIMNGTDNGKVFEWLDKFETTVVREQLQKWNVPEDEIRKIASWRKRYEETVSGYVTDNAGSSVPLPWLLGGPNGGYGPLLISQTLKINPVLIDPTDFRTIADRLGPIRSKIEKWRRRVIETEVDPLTGEVAVVAVEPRKLVNTPMALTEAIGDLVDYAQARAWKPNILMRPRYLIRTLPDEDGRVLASGIFDHPFQYIAQIFTNKMSRDVYGNMILTTRKAAKIEAQASEAARVVRKFEALRAAGQTTYKGKNLNELILAKQDEIFELNKQLDIFDERIAKLLPGMDQALLRGTPRKTTDLLLNPAAVSGMVRRGNLISVERAVNPDLWSKAMAQRLAERASNGYYRSIAKAVKEGKSVDDIARRFFDGDLKRFLDQYRAEVGNLDPDYVWDLAGVKNFVQKNIDDLNIYTFNGDDRLLDAVIKNNFDGEDLAGATGYQGLAQRALKGQAVAKYEPNKTLKNYIKQAYAKDPNAPVRVNYFPSIFDDATTPSSVVKRVTDRYDALLSLFWDGMYGASSDKLARSPMWAQAKWKRIIELVPVMSPQDAKRLADNVKDMDIFQSIKDDIIDLSATASGEMTLDEVEFLAELFATRFSKQELFDASRKTKFGAAHRKLFPFYDAFVELTGSALKMATNPRVIHSVDKIIGELRSNTFLGSDLDGDGKKEAFLYEDPVSGEEMYAFSASGGFLKEWRKLGLDFKFANTLDSLSMITTPYPSLSPWVAVPVIKMLPETPEFDKLRNLIAPYGIPDLKDPSILAYIVPGASEQVQRILGSNGIELFAKTDERQKAIQAVIRAMQVAATVKDYDPITPGQQGPTGYESLEQWQADGKELGLKIYGLTGWAGLFMPGAPIAQWSAKTKQGNVLISVLSQRWNQIDTEGDKLGLDYQDKIEQFVDEFGSENLVAFLQPITERSITGSNSSREYYDWYRNNKTVVDKYPDVGGYFSPKSGELDPDVWNIQKIAGEVKYKDPVEFAKRVESAVANFIYNRNLRNFEDSIPPAERGTKRAEAALKEEKKRLSQGLKAAYPNWDRASAATTAKNERNIQFEQVRRFVAEPTQQDNPVVIAAKEYLDFRDQNLEYVIANTTKIDQENWKTMTANKAAVTLRGVLWTEGERLAEQYPAFVNLWQNVLSREFISVETEEE